MPHELWPNRIFTVDQLPSRSPVSSLCRPLRRGPPTAGVLLLGSVSDHALRSVDLPRKPSRYRGVPSLPAGKTLPPGLPRSRVSLDAGRCQRESRLAHLRRFRPSAHRALRDRCMLTIPMGVDLEQSLYALDSTTIDLCLSLFPWARFRKHKAAVKMHTLLDLHGNIPTFIRVTEGKLHDVNILDELLPEIGAFYVMDRGYIDFERLFIFTLCSAFFVVRTKENVLLQRRYSRPVDKTTGLRSDHTVILTAIDSAKAYPDPLRRVTYFDAEKEKRLKFLTNNFALPALTIAQIYKCRWQVELFFKWIKQHLRIKAFYGTSENAVKTQIWIAVSVYVLVAIVRKRLGLEASLYQILQILSLTLFEKVPISQALEASDSPESLVIDPNQLILFDF